VKLCTHRAFGFLLREQGVIDVCVRKCGLVRNRGEMTSYLERIGQLGVLKIKQKC